MANLIALERQSPAIVRPEPVPSPEQKTEKKSPSNLGENGIPFLPFAIVMLLLALVACAVIGTVGGVVVGSSGRLRGKVFVAILFIIGFSAGAVTGKLIRFGGMKTDFHGYIAGGLASVTAIYSYWAALAYTAIVAAAPGATVNFFRTMMPDVMFSYITMRTKVAGGLGFVGLLADVVIIGILGVCITVVVCTDYQIKPKDRDEAQARADDMMRYLR